MQSVLITGTIEKTKKRALEIIKQNKISKFDCDLIETEKSVGVGEIRLLQKRVFLKPLKSAQKAIILEAFFGMTTEAQNAFLKLLEEPPVNTIIIVLTNSLDFLLPTVISRCFLINLFQQKQLTAEEKENYQKILLKLKNKNTGEALILAQNNGKSREEALVFLESFMLAVQENLEKDKGLVKIFKDMQKTYTIIKTANVSPRFALENLFLNLE